MNFLAPSFLWLLALAVPVVALYFFRQRREDRLVPTNFLWVQAIQDTRTAAVLRKFLKSLLLVLQLLFLALSVLALAGATADLLSRGAPRLVIALLDRSASMAVKDAGGRTRLEAAKEALSHAVDGLQGEDRMMLVAVDERAEVLVPFTGQKARLLDAAGRVEVRDLGTDFSDAVTLLKAQRTASVGRETEVLVLSDGAFPDPGTIQGTKVSFVPFGDQKDNAGITDLKVAHSPGAPPGLFVSVEAFGEKELRRTLALYRDGKVLDAREVEAPPRGQAVAVFSLGGVEPGPLEVRLAGEDPFPADDAAWIVVRPDPKRRFAVYSKGRNRWLEQLPVFRPGLEGPPLPVRDSAGLHALLPLDLVVYDGEVPPDPPRTPSAIYVNCVPPGKGPVTVEGKMQNARVIDWTRTHPVTRHAEFSELIVLEALRLQGVPKQGVLVEAVDGPLLALVGTSESEALFIPFDLAKSNFPLKVAFPLVMANALEHFFSARRTGDPEEVLRTGDTMVRAVPAGEAIEVKPPGAERVRVVAGGEDRAAFRETWRAGLYEVTGPGEGEKDSAAAALLRREESDIGPRERVAAGGVEHAAAPEAVRSNILLRDPLLLLALAILTIEWLLWVKRR